MAKNRISISEVAEKAGVSSMTVSRVIRGGESVREETRRRVEDTMIQLGYVPSAAAQALRSSDARETRPSGLIALVFGSGTESSVTFFHQITRGVEKAASELGLSPIYVSHYRGPRELWMRLQSLFSIHALSGALLVGQFAPDIQDFIQDNVGAVVVVDGPAGFGTGMGSVESGNLEGSLLALDYLASRGCRKIAVITVDAQHYFAQAMSLASDIRRGRAGLAIDVWYDCDSCEAAREMVVARWSSGDRFDAIFTNDDFAIGAMKALRELGVAVPQDVRIVGFDDIPYAAFTVPPLTSVRIDQYLLGEEAVRTLVALTSPQGKAQDIKKVIRPSLIVRDSA